MKNFTHDEIKGLTIDGAISPHGHIGDGVLYEFEQIKHFPQELHYPFLKEKTYYILPDFALRLSDKKIKKHKKILNEWMGEAKVFYEKNENYFRYMMRCTARPVIVDLVSQNDTIDILSDDFWKSSFCFSSNKGVGHFSTLLSSKVEPQDIEDFQKTLPERFYPFSFQIGRGFSTHDFKNNIHYYTFTKALSKVEDYSLDVIPKIFIYRLEHSVSESMRLEVLKSLKKYKFTQTEPYVRFLYEKSKSEKVIELAKQIIKDNHAYQEEKKLFLNQEQFVRHYHKLEINFLYLKEKAQDNLIVAQTLIGIVCYTLKQNYYTLSREDTENSITFEVWSLNPDELKNFSSDMEKCIHFAFTDFLTPEYQQMLATTRRGERIPYEYAQDFQDKFKESYTSFLMKSKLEQALDEKNQGKVNKI